ncbi:MAG TPA: PQQ-dependent sugar dehydrogenase [Longimicrobiaceae bacterium]|nr:PQQ-dependent sugar dehydrogenase [Longimicrobiaceae bacterium]
MDEMLGSPVRPGRLPVALLLAALATCSPDDVNRPREVAAVEVVAPVDSVEVGGTLQLAATPRASDGSELPTVPVSWATPDGEVASVDDAGRVTGKAVGTATVQASAGARTGSVSIRVVPVAVASVVVSPDTATLLVADTKRLGAVLRAAGGAEITGRAVAWSSDAEAVATVGADGTVTARDAGTATITAEAGGRKGTATVTVVAAPIPSLRLSQVASGLGPAPTHLAAPQGDSRLFVVQVDGQVRIVRGGIVLPGLFLDLRGKVVHDVEQGAFSLAFHPRFASNGHVFVNYTDPAGDIRVERYTVGADPDRADPASVKLILHIDHPPTREHFGGELAFGPDGKLYVSVGDGGQGHERNAQDRSTLLGKILRIDVDAGDPYAIPADNPFVGQAGARGEIWAYGLRNPWRMSFDPEAGLLYVADVGETHWEEVNVVPAGQGGLNYGWPRLEGSHCYPAGTTGCDRSGTVLPAVEYPHDGTPGAAGSAHPTGCSVTGGYVYRGSRMPGLRGHYFYGDLCKGWVRSFRYRNGRAEEQRQWTVDNVALLVSFGRDGAGELYALTHNGRILKFVPAGN